MANLDLLAARHAQAIIRSAIDDHNCAKDGVENLVTRALGVVQEQGVYAGMLYLLSRRASEKEIAQIVKGELVGLLGEPDLQAFNLGYAGDNDNAQALLDYFVETVCSKPVQTLLLVKDLFEQTLTYARYGAKAR